MADPAEETVAAPPPTPAAPADGASDPLLQLPADAASPEKASPPAPTPAARSRGFRLLGEDTSVHKALGGGKTADVLLWKDKKTSAVVIGGATVIWVMFEVLDYHLLTLISHVLIGILAILFLWSKATAFIKKSPPDIPLVQVPEDLAVNVARALRNDINRALHLFREIAMGHDLKKFLGVIVGLWILSGVGSCCDFLTLIYIAVLMLHMVPILYDKYQDKVDHFAGRAHSEARKQYEVLDAKVLSKIPRGLAKPKKQN
ncbi:reticulon-like protein B2 isoform X1 [Phragmites australis]|uniref:reticulon-like protein B2 isoform X1 n=1 Tax=Phragmites australis TaxID=29695 RepID=UPI002D77504C|nr:reticulon-like protein B2 isoform X1 [Phragmites australis]